MGAAAPRRDTQTCEGNRPHSEGNPLRLGVHDRGERAGVGFPEVLPACIFAPPGQGPRTIFGLSPSGELVHVMQAGRGLGDLICPDCGGALIARKGSERIPHFAHTAIGECRHAGETALHLMAKEIIASGACLSLPPFEVEDGYGRWRQVQSATVVSFDTVDTEVFEDGIRPDLIGSVSAVHGGQIVTRRLIIEIRVTHAVEKRKLDILRARGDSVLELDLSKVDRGLDRPALAQLLLDDAPRIWLFHRDEVRMRAEAFRKAASAAKRKEDRKTWAIAAEARREDTRAAARRDPPAAQVSDALRQWAIVQKRNWQMIGSSMLFDAEADDGIFDVPPPIWRARSLMILAPWGEGANGPGFRPDLGRIARTIGKDMRTRGWVKAPFAGDLYRFTNRKLPWDPVGEAIEAFITGGLTLLGYGENFQTGRVNLEYAYSENKRGWKTCESFIFRAVMLARGARDQGIEISIGGRSIHTEEDVVSGLAAAGRLDIAAMKHSLIERMIREIRGDPCRIAPLDACKDIESEGFEFVLCGDEGKGCTERALSHLRRRVQVAGKNQDEG